MTFKKFALMMGLLTASVGISQMSAHADEENEATRLTFTAPVEIPGHVLPAGTYIFEEVGNVDFPNMIRVFNADHTKLCATLQTIPVDRMQITGKPAIAVTEPVHGQPPVLVEWFYGDRLTGHELMYPKQQEREVLQASKENFVGNEQVSTSEAMGE